jgi:hypothetical protein
VLRKTSGPKREVVKGVMKIHNEELNDTQYSRDMIPVVKQRTVQGAG